FGHPYLPGIFSRTPAVQPQVHAGPGPPAVSAWFRDGLRGDPFLEIGHLLCKVPGVDGEEDVKGEEQAVRVSLSLILIEPDGGSDIDLENHYPPPFPDVPVAEPRQEEIHDRSNKRVFCRPRPAGDPPGDEQGIDPASGCGKDGLPPHLAVAVSKSLHEGGDGLVAPDGTEELNGLLAHP